MNQVAPIQTSQDALLPDLMGLCAASVAAADSLFAEARRAIAEEVVVDGRPSGRKLEEGQFGAHGLSWVATYVESLRQMLAWARRLDEAGKLGETEQLILQIAFGEYLWQLYGGIPMSQGEIVRPQDLGLGQEAQRVLMDPAVQTLTQFGNSDAARRRLVELMRDQAGAATFGDCALDEEFDMIRDQFRRFADDKVVPHAHEWHMNDELIPMDLLQEMAEMGVFGLTIPEEFGGFGMGKTAMCVVSEELSRGYIGVGSLGTRSEIAAELVIAGGTDAQKAHWLPKFASSDVLPTAVFTEPNTGSDLGSLRTRAVKDGDDWAITGNKTWITHG
ncbi:MAG: acyl-CoA dehydrogenase family protein, partial [Pseudomonadota bacterium]